MWANAGGGEGKEWRERERERARERESEREGEREGERERASERASESEHRAGQSSNTKKGGWSYTPQDLARGAAVAFKLCISSLHSGVRFGLLCCQPEPVPGSLPARIPQLTPQYPCGPLV